GTVFDLAELELSYAPPFSSAKDPVNMLGFVAENVIKGLVTFLDVEELDRKIVGGENDYIILDVTETVERMVFSIPNSISIPLGEIHARMEELDRNKEIIIYCSIGVRSYNAARVLMQHGFTRVKVLAGGTTFYQSMHHRDNVNLFI
ncbi:MAG: rhodanese-like domain-containing protein, partial [Lachnospiraceae bacterium]